jgi:hypothetical protein
MTVRITWPPMTAARPGHVKGYVHAYFKIFYHRLGVVCLFVQVGPDV